MEYFVLIVTAVSIGLIVRYSLAGRLEYGLLLAPAIALATALVVWAIGLLIGFSADDFLLWAASLIAAGVVSYLVAKVLPGKRIKAHEENLAKLLQR